MRARPERARRARSACELKLYCIADLQEETKRKEAVQKDYALLNNATCTWQDIIRFLETRDNGNNMKSTRRAVGAIIQRTDRPDSILLVKKIKSEDVTKEDITPEWDIPKGGLKDNEIEEEGLWRELGEEVGSKEFDLVRKLPLGMDFSFPPGSRWTRQETGLFYLKYSGPDVKFNPATDEIGEVKWFSVMEAKKVVRHRTTLKAIEEAEKLGLFS